MLREIFGFERKEQDHGDKFVKRSFMGCILHLIDLG
jgi:hypothetical protein